MIKKLLVTAVITMSYVAGQAQECCAPVADNTPLKNNMTAAVTIGYNNYTNISALGLGSTNYGVSGNNSNWTNRSIMLGFEMGWFATENWKLSLGGGFNFKNNPGYEGLEGTFDGDSELGDGSIPNYGSRNEGSNFNFLVYVGADRYFRLKNTPNLMWYAGVRAMYSYGQDRIKNAAQEAADYNGRSVADTWGLGGSAVLGADYFLTRSLYVGAQVDVLSYNYSKNTYLPSAGYTGISTDNHNIGALACPMAKVGFRFGKSKPMPKREMVKTVETVKEIVHDTIYVEVPVEKQVDIEDLPSANVFFSRAKSEISAEEDASIRQLIKDVNGRNVYYLVVGYADKGTGNPTINKKYSKDRAERVAKALNEKYGVASSDIKVDWKGDSEQPFAENNKNRVAIITVEKK